MLKWFAVLVELEVETKNPELVTFGWNPKTRSMLRVDLSHQGKAYAVQYKCGEFLEEMAKKKANQYGGFYIQVESDYFFNNEDIRLSIKECAAAA